MGHDRRQDNVYSYISHDIIIYIYILFEKDMQLISIDEMALRGLLIYALGCFLMGSRTSPWTSTICGLLFIGSGWGLCWTPVLPTMVETAADKLRGIPSELARHRVSPPVSGAPLTKHEDD